MANTPDWLQPDATWDPLHAYDIGTSGILGDQIRHRYARMIQLGRSRP